MDNELSRFVDSMAALVIFVTPTAEIEHYNREFLDYTGRTVEELKDWVKTDVVHPDDVHMIFDTFRTLDAGLPYDKIVRVRRADGEYRRFRSRLGPCFDDAGAIVRWCSVMTDVEDQKRADALLEGEVRMLEMVALGRPLSEVADGLCRLTEDLVPGCACSILLVGPEGFRAGGAGDGPADALVGRPIDAAFDPCSLSVLLKAPVIVADIGVDPRWAASPWPGRMAEGRACWATPILSDAGEVAGVFAVYRPESASLKAAETELIDRFTKIAGIAIQRAHGDEALRATEVDLRRALLHIAEGQRLSRTGSFTADLQRDEHSWSEELFRIFEMDPAGRPGVQVVRDLVHPADLPLFDAEIERALSEGVNFDFRILTNPAGEKHVRAFARVTEHIDGHPILIGFVQDVTESKLAEEELRRSTASLMEAEHLSKTGSYFWLIEESEPAFSDEMRVIFGYEPDEPVTMADIWARMVPEDLPTLDVELEAARTGHPTASLFRMQMRDGAVKHLRSITRGARMRDGHMEMTGCVQDITETRLAEEALSRARSELAHVARVATLNAMTASIAHEVAQPLSGILTNASTALRMLAADPPNLAGVAETAQRTVRDANRASEVIQRLRAMFSTKAPTLESVDLNDAARDVIALSTAELQRNGALLQTALADDLPRIRVDRVQLQQVILNLLLNAADAMAEVQGRPRTLLVETGLNQDGAVKLAVRDAGTGLEAHAVEKLFEAFYTTKPNGMGVGLSICRSIIETHNGRLWAEANEGPGATFSFSIPTGPPALAALS